MSAPLQILGGRYEVGELIGRGGMAEVHKGHDTRLGSYRIFRSFDTWRYSTIYTSARMYKPMQFDGGEALHGSSTDALVKTHPASHGCVRMLHRDIDALHAGGVGVGTRVTVFGSYTA